MLRSHRQRNQFRIIRCPGQLLQQVGDSFEKKPRLVKKDLTACSSRQKLGPGSHVCHGQYKHADQGDAQYKSKCDESLCHQQLDPTSSRDPASNATRYLPSVFLPWYAA